MTGRVVTIGLSSALNELRPMNTAGTSTGFSRFTSILTLGESAPLRVFRHKRYGRLNKAICIAVVCGFAFETFLLTASNSALGACTSPGHETLPDVKLLPVASIISVSPHFAFAADKASSSATPTGVDSATKITGLVESIFKIIALVVGGLFAYWKFFMGRTFHPRLEPAISATARLEDNQTLLSVVCKLKNVGLSRVELDRENSAIRVLLQTLSRPRDVTEVQWPKRSKLTVDVFQSHEWIEGGETIEDAHLFVFPYVANQACRVELRVLRARRTFKERFVEWNRRRKGPNAWSQHVILDRFISDPPDDEQTGNTTE